MTASRDEGQSGGEGADSQTDAQQDAGQEDAGQEDAGQEDAGQEDADTLQVTILGCGSSGGVPRIGNVWGACDPQEPRNRRRRCSLLVQRQGPGGTTTVLVDTGPDMRQQLLDTGVTRLDGVLYTHAHADHIHGIDDLRVLAIHNRARVDVWFDEETGHRLHQAFGYCFETPPGSSYPPILNEHLIKPGEPITVSGAGGAIQALPLAVEHGEIGALGFRFGGLAYLPDVSTIPPDVEDGFRRLDTWIIDALRPTPHPSHFSLSDALAWIAKLAPRRAVLTNMHIDLDYQTLRQALPVSVEPAYDGMKLSVPIAR